MGRLYVDVYVIVPLTGYPMDTSGCYPWLGVVSIPPSRVSAFDVIH